MHLSFSVEGIKHFIPDDEQTQKCSYCKNTILASELVLLIQTDPFPLQACSGECCKRLFETRLTDRLVLAGIVEPPKRGNVVPFVTRGEPRFLV